MSKEFKSNSFPKYTNINRVDINNQFNTPANNREDINNQFIIPANNREDINNQFIIPANNREDKWN